MEFWDVYDKDRQKTGKTVRRGIDSLAEGEYHLAVEVAIRSREGKLLIQRRSLEKEDWPGIWDLAAAGGSALAGETGREAARRELYKELGIAADFPDPPLMSFTLDHCFGEWFLLELDPPLKDLRFQPGEVMDARWAGREEILSLLEEGKLVDYHPGFVDLLLTRDGHTGAMRSWKGRYGTNGN